VGRATAATPYSLVRSRMTPTPTDVQGRGYTERARAIRIDSVCAEGAMLWTDDVVRRENRVEHHASEPRCRIFRLCRVMGTNSRPI
jgi:hypothetical protein